MILDSVFGLISYDVFLISVWILDLIRFCLVLGNCLIPSSLQGDVVIKVLCILFSDPLLFSFFSEIALGVSRKL